MNVKIKNTPNLIGDFLGCLPALQEMSKHDNIFIDIIPEAYNLFELIPKKYNIQKITEETKYDIELLLSIDACFSKAVEKNWYMSTSFMYHLFNTLPVIINPKADLEWDDLNSFEATSFYLISPFARSLPPNEKLKKTEWEKLAKLNPHDLFLVLGNSKYDLENYIQGDNVIDFYDRPLKEVCHMMKKCKALISVVTGTSHLAFHLGVKNYVLNNQNMTWGRNPDGIHIENPIPDLKAEDINSIINQTSNGK